MASVSTIPLYALYLLFDIEEEILVTTAMAIAWVPISSITIAVSHRPGARILSFEVLGAIVLWIQYLVGAAYFTNKVFDGKGDCTPDMSNKDCDVMTTILAFTWIEWSLMTFIMVLSISRINNSPAIVKRKGAEV
ncbi:hypothetical protein BDZ89DRAFT_1058074 [Hymenopellis radicata]|nr:hypothetical protein BDZ89DRAFT_1058074 [Hymenopellis radicata]